MTVVTEESRKRMLLSDIVLEEIESVRGHLPIGDDRRDVVVDGEIRIFVYRFAYAGEVPPLHICAVGEARQVQRLLGRDHEVVPHAGLLIHLPLGRIRKDEPVVRAPRHPSLRPGMRRVQQRYAPVGVDVENGGSSVTRGAVVHSDTIPPLEHWLVSTVEPNARFEGYFQCRLLSYERHRHRGGQQ